MRARIQYLKYLNAKVVFLVIVRLEESGHLKIDDICACVAKNVNDWRASGYIVINPTEQTPLRRLLCIVLLLVLGCARA